MLTRPTPDQLRTLRLDGMAEALLEVQTQTAGAASSHIGAAIEDVGFRNPRRTDRALRHCPRNRDG